MGRFWCPCPDRPQVGVHNNSGAIDLLAHILMRLDEEHTSETANAELIALIEHRLREPLGPTLLVLQLLLRQESLSPQGVAFVRMLQRSVKEEVRNPGIADHDADFP